MPVVEHTPSLVLDDPKFESGWSISKLIDHTYSLIDEERNEVARESFIHDLINFGFRELYNNYGYPFARASYIVFPGTNRFTLVDTKLDPDGRSQIDYVYLYRGDTFIGELKEKDKPTPPTTIGTPTSFWQDGEVLVLDADPDQAYKVVVRYRHMPATYDGADTPPVPHDKIQAVCWYAAAEFKLKDDQFGSADRWQIKWNKALEESRTWQTGVYSYAKTQ